MYHPDNGQEASTPNQACRESDTA